MPEHRRCGAAGCAHGGGVPGAGTLSGNPIAVAAGTAQLKLLENTPDLYDRLEKSSAKLEAAMHSAGINVNRCGSLMTAFFTDRPVCNYDDAKSSDVKKYAEYFGYLLDNGIYTAPSQFEAMFVSYAHTDEDISRTCEVIGNYRK